jgi:hypothetical protein
MGYLVSCHVSQAAPKTTILFFLSSKRKVFSSFAAVCLFIREILYIVTCLPKVRIVKSEETSIAGQRLGKHVATEAKQCDNAFATIADSW